MQQFEILIIGGGLGGLALANGLQKNGIPFHVFERDRTENYRAQGYRIRIGAAAIESLEYLLTPEALSDFDLSCADYSMHPIPEIDAESRNVVEPNVPMPDLPDGVTWEALSKKARCVDRAAMREVLMKHLSPERISYDKVFTHYEERFDSAVTAFFDDGSSAYGGLLIGADGRNSRVRQQLLPSLKLEDIGGTFIYGKTYITPELRTLMHPVILQRMSFLKDRGSHNGIIIAGVEPIMFSNSSAKQAKGLSTPKDYLFWGLSAASATVGFTPGTHEHLSVQASTEKALEVSARWHPSLQAMIRHQAPGETAAFNVSIVEKDFGTKSWESNPRITIMGDAAHPMAATGSGAVTAFVDAKLLCRGLVERQDKSQTNEGAMDATIADDYKPFISEYETSMRKNAGEAVLGSWMAMSNLVSMTQGGPEIHMGEMAMRIRNKNVPKKAL